MEKDSITKLRGCFDSMVVYKDLKNSNFFATLGLPSFLRDWLLQRQQDSDGRYSPQELAAFVRQYIPRRADWTKIKDCMVIDYEKVKILAKIKIDIDIASGGVAFSLPDFGLTSKQTVIESDVWSRHKENLVSGKEVWGMLELGYRPPDDLARPKQPGKIRLLSFRDFCPYEVDIDYYKDVRSEFNVSEWIDILLAAIDCNPHGYEMARKQNRELPETEDIKLALLSRLLPFLEKRLNLIELAPKGTGKSYIFGQISRHGWLSTSDRITRAKLFYDMSKKEHGLFAQNDFLALDEIQKTVFDDGMGATLQGYLEQGKYNIGNISGIADCGMILLGNIAPELMRADGSAYMFDRLPPAFHDPALIDRFHGFIKGWHIPRMNEDLKISGWALNSEYFTAILHELRSDGSYRAMIDEIVEVPAGSDTRDTEAVKRIATALLKLLFPNVRNAAEIPENQFMRYCLRPALAMRFTIKRQLALMDEQYQKSVPNLGVKKA